MKISTGSVSGALLIAAIILLIVFMPFAMVWAWNILFGIQTGLVIGYTWQTWLAVIVLGVFFRGFDTKE